MNWRTRTLADKQTLGIFSLAVLAVLSGLAVGLWGCNSNSSNPYGAAPGPAPVPTSPNTVLISGYAYSPSTMTVPKNTTVTWKNNDAVTHTATSDNSAWDTGSIVSGASKSLTFTTTGTFTYHCTVHPMMTATIIVQ